MKKKAYLAPLVRVVNVATTHHICIGSPGGTEGLTEKGKDLDNGGDNPGEFSRGNRGGYWE